MAPKLENLDVNMSADEIAEYIDRFNFWVDTKETSDDRAITGGRKGSIYLTESAGLSQNSEGRFYHRNKRSTSISYQACPILTR